MNISMSCQRKSTALILGVLLALMTVGSATAAEQRDPARFHLFLLVGQPNMSGRGKVEPRDRAPHERALMLNRAGTGCRALTMPLGN